MVPRAASADNRKNDKKITKIESVRTRLQMTMEPNDRHSNTRRHQILFQKSILGEYIATQSINK